MASLRQQLERLQGGGWGGGRVGGGSCGREATCGRSLQAMERAHKQALEELQKQHARETRELERDRDRVLREETQDTAQGQGSWGQGSKLCIDVICTPIQGFLLFEACDVRMEQSTPQHFMG